MNKVQLGIKYIFLIILIPVFIWLFAFGGYRVIYPEYVKVEPLSSRLTSTPTLVRNMLMPGERIAKWYSQLEDENYENEGGYLIRTETYCSYDISSKIDDLIKITGVTSFKGNLELVSKSDFKKYLELQQAYCVEVLPLNNPILYKNIDKALSWGLDAEGMIIYRKR